MDINFLTDDDVPLPPEEVKILKVSANAYPDFRRVKLSIETSPFQLAPNVEIEALNSEGQRVASTTIIGAMAPLMALTLHFKERVNQGEFLIRCTLSYPDLAAKDTWDLQFVVDPPDARGDG
jgi:hypothetical protein